MNSNPFSFRVWIETIGARPCELVSFRLCTGAQIQDRAQNRMEVSVREEEIVMTADVGLRRRPYSCLRDRMRFAFSEETIPGRSVFTCRTTINKCTSAYFIPRADRRRESPASATCARGQRTERGTYLMDTCSDEA